MDNGLLSCRHYIHSKRISNFLIENVPVQIKSAEPPQLRSREHRFGSKPTTERLSSTSPRRYCLDPDRSRLAGIVSRLRLQYDSSTHPRDMGLPVIKSLNNKPANQRKIQLESALRNVYMTDLGGHIKRTAILWRRFQHLKPSSKVHETERKQSQTLTKANRVSKIHGFLSQRDIKGLLNQTNYDRRELYVMYVRYKALCSMSPFPNGIDKATFKKGVARLAVEDDLFVDRVFDLVDEDGSGCIEWPEFLSAMSALEKGNQSKKMTFFLRTYDLDGDGFVSRGDLYTMLLSSCMLEPDEVTVDLVNSFVERLFGTLGAADKDKLSLDDIMTYMNSINNSEDVWEVFGRSMLRDFGGPKVRRHPDHIPVSNIGEMS